MVLLILVLSSKSHHHLLPQLGTLHLTLRVFLRLANRPSAQFANSSKQEQFSSFKNNPQASGTILPFFKSSKGISCTSLHWAYLEQEMPSIIFLPFAQCNKQKKTSDKLLTRMKFQCFLNKAPRSSFMKLIISTPLLLRVLHTTSLAKSFPNGLKPQECKRTKLREPPLIPYIPEKDKVQGKVAD